MSENITKNKLLHNIGRAAGDFRPITADIFLTNFCNNNCPYCTYKRWEFDDDAAYISYEDFIKYAERLIQLGVLGIILTGGGEPTVNPDFDKITRWLEDNHIHYGINTNFNILRYFAPDYLKVSLDAWDEESYKKCRGVERYATVRDNIKRYSEWRKTNAPKTSLGIQKVATVPGDVIKFYEANKDLDVDYIVFRPIESTAGRYYFTDEEKINAKLIVQRVKYLAKNDSRVKLNFKWNMLQTRFDKCVAHWSQMALNERGEVIYCCHKPYEVIGHILDKDIFDKWMYSKTDMSMCDVPCRLTAPNMFMEEVEKEAKDSMFI